MMNIHYVIAHPRADSFNKALVKVAQLTLGLQHTTFSDLYELNFKAVADWDDFKTPTDESTYNLAQQIAVENNALANDIQAQIQQIEQADLIILQFPLWWFSVPAILKGWFDRVLVKGIAYDKGKWFSDGGFSGKKVMLALTTQAPETAFASNGLNRPIEQVLFPIHQALRLVGFDIIEPFVGYAVATQTKEQNKLILDDYQASLKVIGNRPLLPFPPISAYNETLQLKE